MNKCLLTPDEELRKEQEQIPPKSNLMNQSFIGITYKSMVEELLIGTEITQRQLAALPKSIPTLVTAGWTVSFQMPELV